MYTLY